MSKVLLVTGIESRVGWELIEKILHSNYHVAAPAATQNIEHKHENLKILQWNPSSWISTKAIVTEAIHHFEKIDAALILHRTIIDSPPSLYDKIRDITVFLEQNIISTVSLTRELYPLLKKSEGVLAYVLTHPSGKCTSSLDALSEGAFIRFATQNISKTNSPVWTCGLQNISGDSDAFHSALIPLLDERPRKLKNHCYRYRSGYQPFGTSVFSETFH